MAILLYKSLDFEYLSLALNGLLLSDQNSINLSEFCLVCPKFLDEKLKAVFKEFVIVFNCEDGTVSDVAHKVLEE